MGWLDAWERRAREAIGSGPLPTVEPRPPTKPQPEIKTVWVQTAAPRDGDAGCCEAGFYSVADGVVTMHDEDGRPTGKARRLAPGDDPRMIAGRLTRAVWAAKTPDFNRPLYYPEGSWA